MPGFFLSLEGVDGVGKTTQAQLLAEGLQRQGRCVTTCRDPGGTVAGDRIRAILLDPELTLPPVAETFLFQASRSLLVAEVIRPALERDEVVITDRFLLSTVVYQGHAGGLAPAELWSMGRLATGGVLPGRTLVLDMPAASAAQRGTRTADRIEAKGLAYLESVRQGFLAEARAHADTMVVIDANRAVDAVAADVRREVAHVLGLDPRTP
ncbi:MAG TPA: dTMP kinase [Gemmatales bacterium]|nr:dTMP kinase [Gemmatales bacterium]